MSADLHSRLGSTLGTAYTIERELGGGGMARVFAAIDTALARRVVIKVLSPDLAAGISAQRFAREIRLAASLQQANIVPVLAAGETDGLPYYVMPFVDGLSLRNRLERDGRLTMQDAINTLRDVARALAYAHEHGVVHRDIKPENILLSGDSAVVTDFGIARALTRARADSREAHPEPTITQLGSALGTPAYMAPEQIAADPNVDHRADIYAFGCVAYELLAGASPFAGSTAQQLFAAHLSERPVPLGEKSPDCVPGVAALVMQCLEKNVVARPQTAREVLSRLERPNASATALERMLNRFSSWRRRVALAVVVLIAALAMPAWAWLRGGNDAPRIASVAVIPFTNVGGDTAQEYLAEGLADELTTALGKVSGVRVVSRAMSARYRGRSDIDAKVIGRELAARYIVLGTLRRVGGQLRISTQLISASDNSETWSDDFAGAAENAYAVQDSITRAVGRTLQLQLGGAVASLGVPATASIGTRNSQAYDLYLRGKLLLARRGPGVVLAIEKFEQAIALDSGFARAYAGLGVALELLPIFTATPAASLHDRAIQVARRALALDSTQAEAYTTLGLAHQSKYEWEPALAAHRRAVALDSMETSARIQYARLLYHLRRFEESSAEFDKARRFDPYSAVASAWAGHLLSLTGRNAQGIAELERALEIDSLNPPGLFMMVQAVLKASRRDSAKAIADRLVRAFPAWRTAAGVLYGLLGERATVEGTLRQLAMADSVVAGRYSTIAMVALAIRDSVRALDALERATDAREPWPTWGALSDRHFDPVLGSPRFSAVLRRVGLDERTFKSARSGGSR